MGIYHWTEKCWRIVFAAILIAFLATGAVGPIHSAQATEEPVADEWIFQVIMPPWMISQAIFAYQYEGRYYLPVLELGQGFEFFLEAEIDRAYISGFASDEANSFVIDGERGEIIVKGRKESIPSYAILRTEEVPDDDLYVQVEVLNKIWPVDMTVNLSNLSVVVSAEEELSFQRALERRERRKLLEVRQEIKKAGARKEFPIRNNPYQWFGKPIVDIQTSYTYDHGNREFSGENNFTGTQQLGKMIAEYSANFAYDTKSRLRIPESLRLQFSRTAPEGSFLLLPIIQSFEAGDVSVRQRDLISNSIGGRGLVVSNKKVTDSREFDRITVEGTGPPGWEIELYNNDELIDFGAVQNDGEYRFEDVILNFGNNLLRMVMYGPQGQVREEVQEYNVAGSMLGPGEFQYTAGFADEDRPFVYLDAQPSTSNVRGIGKTFTTAYGLNKKVTAFGSFTEIPTQEDLKQYITAGLSFSTPFGFGEVEGYRGIGKGSALDTRFITELLGVRLNMRSTFFNHLQSPDAGFGDSTTHYKGEVQANTTVRLPFSPVGLRVNLNHTETYGGIVSTNLATSQSLSIAGARLSNSTTTRFFDEKVQATNGRLNGSFRVNDWQFRGNLAYKVAPETDLSSGQLEVRYTPKDTFQAAVNFNHDFQNSLSGGGLQLGYDFGNILTSFDANYAQEDGWEFIMRASTSINPYGHKGNYTLNSQSQRGNAPMQAHVFFDTDADGLFDPETDEPIENAVLKVNGTRTRDKADKDGYVVVSGAAERLNSVEVDLKSLEDPYLVPKDGGFSTVALPGSMPVFDFPIIETGSIDGTVWREGTRKEVEGLKVQLVNAEGEVIMESLSAFDGYYAFEFVPPGTYTVRADPDYEVNVPPETVTVSSDELFAYGVDLYLLERVAEEAAAEQADGSSGVAQTTTAPAAVGTQQPAPLPEDGELSAVIKQMRIGRHPDKIRLVLELTGPITYSVSTQDNGHIIIVDLPDAGWNTKSNWHSEEDPSMPLIASYRTEPLPSGKGTRLILEARTIMSTGSHGLLDPEGSEGHKLYIDLK